MNRNSEDGPARLDVILNTIEENCDPSQYVTFCVPFMLDCSALIGERVPPRASRALQIARGYRAGVVPLQSVSDMHDSCWRHLGVGGRDMLLDDPEVAAIRAVICILHRQLHPKSDDFVDFLSFFLVLLNKIEPHSMEQEQLLRKHFAHCLPQ